MTKSTGTPVGHTEIAAVLAKDFAMEAMTSARGACHKPDSEAVKPEKCGKPSKYRVSNLQILKR
jgi:hypothetical protein